MSLLSLFALALANLNLDCCLSVLTDTFCCGLKRLDSVLEEETMGDHLGDVDGAGADKVDRGFVGASSVAEGASDVDLLDADTRDGEFDFRSAHTDLDKATLWSKGLDAHVDAGLSTGTLEYEVEAFACCYIVTERADEVLCIACGCFGLGFALLGQRRLESRSGTPLFSELELAFHHINDHHSFSRVGLADGSVEQTNGTSTENEDVLHSLDLTAHTSRVDSYGKRLHEGSLLERHVIGHMVRKRALDVVICAQRPIVRGCSSELKMGTLIVHAVQADLARSARNARLESNAIADLVRGDTLSDGSDDAARLVTEHHGLANHKVTDTTMVKVVTVGSAQTSLTDVDLHLTRLGRNDGAFFEQDFLDLLQHE